MLQCPHSVKFRVPDSQSPLASAHVFDPQQSRRKLLEVLELTHSSEHQDLEKTQRAPTYTL